MIFQKNIGNGIEYADNMSHQFFLDMINLTFDIQLPVLKTNREVGSGIGLYVLMFHPLKL